MKQPAGYPAVVSQGDDTFLGIIQIPTGRQDAAILAGVGVTQHDLLDVAGGLQQFGVGRIIEQGLHHRVDPTQIIDGLEQG